MQVGIVIGSIREGRVGAGVGEWVAQQAATHPGGIDWVVVDLKSFDVPLFEGAYLPMMAGKKYASPAVQAWSGALDACDAFVFVTPEYNHSVPGAFKNAIDSVGPELVGKPVGLVGYGAVGGVRAIEHWRAILSNFSAPTVRAEVNLSLFTDIADGAVKESDLKNKNLADLFNQLVDLARKLSAAS
ncbi:NADPH-dependent FMN reductase [Propioniciclava tarda]|uniref:NAD(P)H-dependent oxidoreductase n=1 Tax=Propioniciclava tarda TaxID=433330 RepID=A0A4Q9KN32_PROTD|nr:NADPH-dependent FMN reductase [Propioniciclava tarda]TBT95958.1 NAD(P)H-dependent oxidoreductase [Propioniciclava tarda]SMO42011.1 NAD(P)H-dependent FMN reductase [Propioniciclava tarda]